jgi:hypothetical protein
MTVTVVEVAEPPAIQSLVESEGVVTAVEVPATVVAVVVPEVTVTEIEVGVVGPQGVSGVGTIPFSRTGDAGLMTGSQRLYMEYTGIIKFVRASVGTAPTGSSLIIDVNKNGTTIYTTQSKRPQIAAGTFTDLGDTPDVAGFVQGDYLTIDIDQVGSTLPGADLVVTLTLERA